METFKIVIITVICILVLEYIIVRFVDISIKKDIEEVDEKTSEVLWEAYQPILTRIQEVIRRDRISKGNFYDNVSYVLKNYKINITILK